MHSTRMYRQRSGWTACDCRINGGQHREPLCIFIGQKRSMQKGHLTAETPELTSSPNGLSHVSFCSDLTRFTQLKAIPHAQYSPRPNCANRVCTLKDGTYGCSTSPKWCLWPGLNRTCAVQIVTEFITAGKSGFVDVTQPAYPVRLSQMTQGCNVANLLNCTAVCPRCGKWEVNNIETTGKSVA
jgi:hypothetical protein